MNQDIFEFVIYLIHACANTWKMSPSKVYAKLMEASCISDYLVPYHDVLHTQSSRYIVEDIQRYLTQRGVAL